MPDRLETLPRNAPAPAPGDAGREEQYLAFRAGGETFALATACIREVIPFEGLTIVPLMPSFLRGVINLRGSVVPVIDLLQRFGRPALAGSDRTCVVILEDADQAPMGVLVDSVSEVMEIAEADVDPVPAFGTGIRPDFIRGVARRANHFILLLNPATVLSVEEMSALAASP